MLAYRRGCLAYHVLVTLIASRRLLLGIALLLTALLCLTPRPATEAAQQPAALAWESCGGGFECVTLAVPLDQADTAGRRICLALVCPPATHRGASMRC